jgi:hypothetical protein
VVGSAVFNAEHTVKTGIDRVREEVGKIKSRS